MLFNHADEHRISFFSWNQNQMFSELVKRKPWQEALYLHAWLEVINLSGWSNDGEHS